MSTHKSDSPFHHSVSWPFPPVIDHIPSLRCPGNATAVDLNADSIHVDFCIRRKGKALEMGQLAKGFDSGTHIQYYIEWVKWSSSKIELVTETLWFYAKLGQEPS